MADEQSLYVLKTVVIGSKVISSEVVKSVSHSVVVKEEETVFVDVVHKSGTDNEPVPNNQEEDIRPSGKEIKPAAAEEVPETGSETEADTEPVTESKPDDVDNSPEKVQEPTEQPASEKVEEAAEPPATTESTDAVADQSSEPESKAVVADEVASAPATESKADDGEKATEKAEEAAEQSASEKTEEAVKAPATENNADIVDDIPESHSDTNAEDKVAAEAAKQSKPEANRIVYYHVDKAEKAAEPLAKESKVVVAAVAGVTAAVAGDKASEEVGPHVHMLFSDNLTIIPCFAPPCLPRSPANCPLSLSAAHRKGVV